jgi:serine/threonine protein kinase
MAITDPFVLPPGTALQPASELPEQLRRDVGMRDGDYALSRSNSRTYSKVIDAEAAMLVSEFEKPSTIAQAVARLSKRRRMNPEQLLEDAFPLLRTLMDSGLLVPSNSEEAARIGASLSARDDVDGWTVVRCVQTLEDTEIYQVRDPNGRFGAIKIGRSNVESAWRHIRRESIILSELDAIVTPTLIRRGEWNSRPYLLTEWLPGTEAQFVCAELRQSDDAESRLALLHVTSAILQAYAHLHEQGIVHGDVHPRNVLIDRRHAVKIIDLGLAHQTTGRMNIDGIARGGVSFFLEPEFALAASTGMWPAPPTPAGEQYSLAALLYLLVTGSHYLDFALEKNEMLRQIAEDSMVPFAKRGIDAWPDVERLLDIALSKRPEQRFASVADFARAWAAVDLPASGTPVAAADASKLSAIRGDVITASRVGGPLLLDEPLPAPSTSLTYGSAGLALALCAMACIADDGELLATADVWSNRAVRAISDADAFYDEGLGITAQRVGSTSLYHGPAGVHVVQALIARARGDIATQSKAVQAFIETCSKPCDVLDLTMGNAGALLGCAFLLDAVQAERLPNDTAAIGDALQALGNDLLERLWKTIASYPPIGSVGELNALGIAHGWAGILYAVLCWCAVAGEPLPPSTDRRLRELAACAEPVGRGLQWRVTSAGKPDERSYLSGWCNGSAGYVFLWTKAYRATKDARYLELAEGAAWHAWEMPSFNAGLCCGTAGQIYALLNFYRCCGDSIWLRRAREALNSAARRLKRQRELAKTAPEWRTASLYKGEAGLAVLASELEKPDQARMPMFELDA